MTTRYDATNNTTYFLSYDSENRLVATSQQSGPEPSSCDNSSYLPCGNIGEGTYRITWPATPGATYELRVDDQSNGWSNTCSWTYDGDVCVDTLTTNSFQYTFKKGHTYSWFVHVNWGNPLGAAVNVPDLPASANFSYDGDGNRVRATAGGVTTTYIGNYFEWTGSAGSMKKYYYADGARMAMRTGSTPGKTGLTWLLGDHLGSTNLMVDAANTANRLRQGYKAWGETRYSVTSGSGTATTTFGYTGQRKEDSIKLLWFGSSWTDAQKAGINSLYRDTNSGYYVVTGDKGRVYVFEVVDGELKLHTGFRSTADAIFQKVINGQYENLTYEEYEEWLQLLKSTLGSK